MRINIEVIPHAQQRYRSAGDWWVDDEGVLQIRASAMKNPRYSNLVILHELIEVLVETIKRQDSLVPPKYLVNLTDKFDQLYEEKRPEDDNTSEPGYDNACPVYQGHMVASAVEHLAAMLMAAVDYNDYQAAIAAL